MKIGWMVCVYVGDGRGRGLRPQSFGAGPKLSRAKRSMEDGLATELGRCRLSPRASHAEGNKAARLGWGQSFADAPQAKGGLDHLWFLEGQSLHFAGHRRRK